MSLILVVLAVWFSVSIVAGILLGLSIHEMTK